MACPFLYNISLTGDCSNTNSGEISLSITGAPNFTISWVSPVVTSPTISGSSPTTYTYSGLSAGTYTISVSDGCIPPTTQFISFPISSGTCVSIDAIQNTTCNSDNGILTASTANFYSSANFYLYDNTSGYITSGNSVFNTYVFPSLSAGTYYVIADDGGGCTGKSETCVIKSSTTFTYGFYIVNNAGCSPYDTGAIYITGITGNPPYTYSWSNGQTGQTATGLTEGTYSVLVTDNTGCSIGSSTAVTITPPVGLGTYFTTPPSCFASDGEISITVTGGTAPYYYLLSNGDSYITFSTSHTFTGLSSGNYVVTVTDAGFCNFNTNIALSTPNLFNTISVTTNDSLCNNTDGSISIVLGGAPALYTYTLTGVSVNQSVTTGLSTIFNNLPSGTYTLTIETSSVPGCVYTQTYTISNTVLFNLTGTTTGTTCNSSNGAVELGVSGGTSPYDYSIIGPISLISTEPTSAYTFNNIPSGNYTATVTDATLCSQTLLFTISPSNNISFNLVGTNPTNGTNGIVSALITQGEPPFTLTWSPNVNGQTELTVTGLTAGTYTLTVEDSIGCASTKSVTILGYNVFGAYQTYNICDTDFENTGELGKKGLQQMLLEGFHDLTIDDVNCVLNQAIFIAEVTVNGETTTAPFYTGTTLGDYPTDSEWFTLLGNTLSAYEGIKEVIVKPGDNQIVIITVCANDEIDYNNSKVSINLLINYDISCVECNLKKYLLQECCEETFYWTLPNGNLTDLSSATSAPSCEAFSVRFDNIEESIQDCYDLLGCDLDCISGVTFEVQNCGKKAIKFYYEPNGLYYWVVQNQDGTLSFYYMDYNGLSIRKWDSCCTQLTMNSVISLFNTFNHIVIDCLFDDRYLLYPYYNLTDSVCSATGDIPHLEVVQTSESYGILGGVIKANDGICYSVIAETMSAQTVTWTPPTVYNGCSGCTSTYYTIKEFQDGDDYSFMDGDPYYFQ